MNILAGNVARAPTRLRPEERLTEVEDSHLGVVRQGREIADLMRRLDDALTELGRAKAILGHQLQSTRPPHQDSETLFDVVSAQLRAKESLVAQLRSELDVPETEMASALSVMKRQLKEMRQTARRLSKDNKRLTANAAKLQDGIGKRIERRIRRLLRKRPQQPSRTL